MATIFDQTEYDKLKQIIYPYEWGMKTLLTKLHIMQENLYKFQDNGAIDHIRSRIKDSKSIAAKLRKLNLALTAENVQNHLQDIAGIRIICPFATDIFFLVEQIRNMPEIQVTTEKDYVSKPKPSGYRSYHIIAQVPVFVGDTLTYVPIEIQLRTEAMNFWSTLEHKARYKYQDHIPDHLSDELSIIAEEIARLDDRMFLVHEIISLINA